MFALILVCFFMFFLWTNIVLRVLRLSSCFSGWPCNAYRFTWYSMDFWLQPIMLMILKHIQVIITSNVKTTNIQRNYVVIYLEIQTSIISLQGGSTWEDRLWLGAEGSALDYPGCFLSCYFPTIFFSVGNFGLGLSRIILVECSDLLGWTEWRYTYVGSIKRSVWRDGYMKNCTKLWVLCCSFNSKIDQEFPSNSTPRKDIGHKAFCIFHHLPLCLIRENASRSLCIRNSCPLTSMPSYLDPGAKREEDCSD